MGWRLLIYLLVALVGLAFIAGCMESKILYQPVTYPQGNWEVPELKESVRDVRFQTDDGVELHGWWAPREDTDTTILWFHGNAGNLTHRYEDFMAFHRLGYQVMIMDYRGYGRSDGSPSERGLYRDGFAAYRFLTEQKDVPPDRLVLLGRSLGGAVATNVAVEKRIRQLILVSPFTNVRDMVPHVLPVPGLHYLVSSEFDSLSRIRQINVPLLVIHGGKDPVIPIELGRKLYEHAAEPKTFVELPEAGHNNIGLVAGREYMDAIRAFVSEQEDSEG